MRPESFVDTTRPLPGAGPTALGAGDPRRRSPADGLEAHPPPPGAFGGAPDLTTASTGNRHHPMVARTEVATRTAPIAAPCGERIRASPGHGWGDPGAIDVASLVREGTPGSEGLGEDPRPGPRVVPRLGDRARAAMRLRRFSPHTDLTCLKTV